MAAWCTYGGSIQKNNNKIEHAVVGGGALASPDPGIPFFSGHRRGGGGGAEENRNAHGGEVERKMHPGVKIFVDHDQRRTKTGDKTGTCLCECMFFSLGWKQGQAGEIKHKAGNRGRGARVAVREGGGRFTTAQGAFNEHSSRCNGKQHPSLNCQPIRTGYTQGVRAQIFSCTNLLQLQAKGRGLWQDPHEMCSKMAAWCTLLHRGHGSTPCCDHWAKGVGAMLPNWRASFGGSHNCWW